MENSQEQTSEVMARGVVEEWAEAHQVTDVGPGTRARLVKEIATALDASRQRGAELQREAYQRRLFEECRTANWDPELKNTFPEEIAHLHEELSEAFRAFRRSKNFEITVDANGKPQGVPIELADVLIGLFYNAELHGFDLFAAVEQKHQYNLTRNYVSEGRQLHATKPSPPSETN